MVNILSISLDHGKYLSIFLEHGKHFEGLHSKHLEQLPRTCNHLLSSAK